MIDGLVAVGQNIWQTAVWMGLFLAALWIIYFIDTKLLKDRLTNRFGLIPRSHFSLLRMLFSPFLHVNRKHLVANSIPFFLLGSLVLVQGQATFWLSTLIIILVAGLGIYFFGKAGTIHMGASGLILGYFGYLLANIFFNPDIITIVIAAIVIVLYLGLITQIVPFKKGVSTTGHLFGFIGGIIAAGVTSSLPIIG